MAHRDSERVNARPPIPQSGAVVCSIDGKVAVITLDRPEALNAWNGALCRGLDAALTWAARDDEIGAVVITGAGRAFCAGADLSSGGDTFNSASDRGADDDTEARTPQVLPWDVPKPVIAAINGHAVGVGATYSLACDIRIVATTAKIAFVFSRRGMLPELASHAVLPSVVGLSTAFDLLLSGRAIEGVEAAEVGLASTCVATENVLETAMSKAKEMAALSAPASMAISKRLIWERLGVGPMMAREQPLFDWVAAQDDAVEGVKSFLEKREPRWSTSAARHLPAQLFE